MSYYDTDEYEREPALHERGYNGNWHAHDANDNTWGNTDRPYNQANAGYTGTRVSDTRGGPMEYGGGRKSRRNARARRNSKKHKRVRHSRRKQTRRHRHRHSRRR